MSKKGVVNLTYPADKLDLKRMAISFDKLYINKAYIPYSKPKNISEIVSSKFEKIANDIEVMRKNDIVEVYEYDTMSYKDLALEEAQDFVKKMVSKHPHWNKENIFEELQKEVITSDFLYGVGDTLARIESSILKREQNINAVPILYSSNSFISGTKKNQVISFVVKKMPLPNRETPWEQILEFRTDIDSRTKYLELINWINNVSLSNKSVTEIEDEFEYLYDQYIRHYKLHKMKSDLTAIEIFVSVGLDMISTVHSVNMIKELFNFRKSRVSLLEDELKLPGKEIAYIYKANEMFK
jgi:hypothetical protein